MVMEKSGGLSLPEDVNSLAAEWAKARAALSEIEGRYLAAKARETAAWEKLSAMREPEQPKPSPALPSQAATYFHPQQQVVSTQGWPQVFSQTYNGSGRY